MFFNVLSGKDADELRLRRAGSPRRVSVAAEKFPTDLMTARGVFRPHGEVIKE